MFDLSAGLNSNVARLGEGGGVVAAVPPNNMPKHYKLSKEKEIISVYMKNVSPYLESRIKPVTL